MSEYSVIHDIGDTLVHVLWANFETDNQIKDHILSSSAQITFNSPADMDNDHVLSLFLFRISENPYMKNQEMTSGNWPQLTYPPCILDLYYMITPRTQNRTNDHILLGKILQIFHDHAVLRGQDLQGGLTGTPEEFRITFSSLSIEAMTEIWNLFRDKSYMLSLCYQLSPVKIDSTKEIEAKRVTQKEAQYYQIVGKKERS